MDCPGNWAEIDGRQKAISSLQKEAEQAPEKAKRVEVLATTLDNAWLTRKQYLTQAHQLQLLKEQARQTEDWLASKEAFLNNDDLGENLDAVDTLIRKHAEFSKLLHSQLGRVDELQKFAASMLQDHHFDREYVERRLREILARRDKLVESCKQRGETLEQSRQLHQFLRNLYHEREWISLKMQIANDQNYRELSNLQSKIQKHAAFESELAANKGRIDDVANHGETLIEAKHYASQEIAKHVEELENQWRELQAAAKLRRSRLQEAYQARVYLRGLDDFTAWLDDVEAQLLSEDHANEGRIEGVCEAGTVLLEENTPEADRVKQRIDDIKGLWDDLKELALARQEALAGARQVHEFDRSAEETAAWVGEKESALGSESKDLASVTALLKRHTRLEQQVSSKADYATQLADNARQLADSNHFMAEEILSKADQAVKRYRQLQEPMQIRRDNLEDAALLHRWDRDADEEFRWLREREAAVRQEDAGSTLAESQAMLKKHLALEAELLAREPIIKALIGRASQLSRRGHFAWSTLEARARDLSAALRALLDAAAARTAHIRDTAALLQKRSLDALKADLDAIKAAHDKLQVEAERLGTAFPDAKEHVTVKLEDVTEALTALVQRADQCSQQLELAAQLQAYFDTYQELLAWTNETLARVTAPDLATDVSGAERLLARHQDIKVEIEAKEEAFQTLYNDGEKLVKEGHFMSSEIEDRMSILRSRRSHLDAAWSNRERIYTQHLDALVFKRDADALDNWITNRVPLVRDGKYGESVAQVEELINRHRDLEETIDAQRDKFNALKRITLVEQAFAEQRNEEEQARRRSAERQEAERLQQYRRREMERITEERRRETAPVPTVREGERLQTSVAPASSEETLSPAPQFDRLPKNEQHVKRAESMSVVKTPKRTPSFTTRRRTQSFRRHRRGDIAELPPVEIEGYLERKQEAGCGGKRATVRSWRAYYSVLCGQLLCFFRDELDFASAKAAAPPQAILNARCEPAGDYTKRANVFRLACADGAEYLFACSSKDLMKDWVAKLSFHAQLPPELQLTPYSSVPPGENSQQSQRTSGTPERHIESTVLPSLPPRQPPQEEDATEVVLRNQEQSQSSSWGRSRFSNGRDINSEFIRSQQNADHGAPPLPLSGPPDRPPLPERAPNLPERGPNLPERAPNLPERHSTMERTNAQGEKQSVSALVNSYQQRMTGNWQGRDGNGNRANTGSWQGSTQNNNWQSVETTSHFYSTSDTGASHLLYILHRVQSYGSSGSNTRPASVAGSGGSPALDQRPASRSSGESELSVSGVSKEKKDKKGVFIGLFSRKKRPQSHM
ncbi:hypothetical protein B5X24_HaOG214442 [Helicoverpa armigera]|uniref:PH domain-containing protein n=1 Tax=Helicoverpa armigera TaxID=29058 RepID=A0A2W1BDP3_HELAM|nr:hypothetical protein B5X24_HaOG214442 [Helicoverpa armigera]